MAQKSVNLDIVLNGRIGSGVGALVDRVNQIGSVIDQVSRKVGEWEKGTVDVYKNYETYMLEAKAAMATNYDSASELEKAYNAMWAQSQKWAATTIFHTNDVSKAIAEAAHAGWDYNKMLEGIPSAMLLAQAGNIDLSSGLDYLIKVLNGTGTAFEDSGMLVDQWVTAANASATTVSELGEAMKRMGATARFGDSTAELLTLLGVLADTGTVGAQAGTLLRNSMIRLIAPTTNAQHAMDLLGADTEELEEALRDGSVAKAAQKLEGLGFSAYDSEGKLKPMISIFKDLHKTLGGLNEEAQNEILSAIFPTRTITGAKSILESLSKIDELYNTIMNSDGAAQRASDTMMSGLMGAQQRFISKWEEFERKFGQTLSDPLTALYDVGGKFIDKLNELDEPTMSAIAGALTTLAELGPVMLAGTGIIKAVGLLGLKGTLLVGAAIGAGALYGYLSKMNELALENNFGTMSVDMEAVNTALNNTKNQLKNEFEGFTQYTAAVKQAVDNYTAAGQSLSENLWSTMVTGIEIDPNNPNDPTIIKLNQYGESMIKAVKDGIELAAAEKMEFISLLFKEEGKENTDDELAQNPLYDSLITLIETGYTEAKKKAESMSQELRSAMTSAFKDGKLTPDEVENIQRIMQQLDEVTAGLRPSDVGMYKLLNKSKTVSLEGIEEFSDAVKTSKEEALAGFDSETEDLLATIRAYYDYSLKNELPFINPDTKELVNPQEVDIDDLIRKTQERATARRTEYEQAYDRYLQYGWQNALATSDTGELFKEGQEYIKLAQSGLITFAQAEGRIIRSTSGNPKILAESINKVIQYYGGIEKMVEMVGNYRNLGTDDALALADWFEQIITMREALGGSIDAHGLSEIMHPETRESNWGMTSYLADIYDYGIGQEDLLDYYAGLSKENKRAWDSEIDKYRQKYNLAEIGSAYGYNGGEGLDYEVLQWLGAYALANGKVNNPSEYTWEEMPYDQNALYNQALEEARKAVEEKQAALDKMQAKSEKLAGEIEQKTKIANGPDDLFGRVLSAKTDLYGAYSFGNYLGGGLIDQKKEVDISVDAARSELETLQAELDGLAEHPPIPVDAEAKLDTSIVDDWKPPAKYQYVYYKPSYGGDKEDEYAFGGRATEASIFGEDGPEWAIPEEHSQRTAYLLRQAAQASGFTWQELLANYGGLNAGRTINVNVGSYAPVIHAQDAAGVEQKLLEDKRRLADVVRSAVRNAMEEMGMRDEVEVYA